MPGRPGRAQAAIGGPGEAGQGRDRRSRLRCCFAWRPTPFRPRSSTCSRSGNAAERDGVPGPPLGGNRLTPWLQGAELGSGVIIDKDNGYIVTNNHVVKDADQILVRLGPGDDVPAGWSVPTPSPTWPCSRSRRT